MVDKRNWKCYLLYQHVENVYPVGENQILMNYLLNKNEV